MFSIICAKGLNNEIGKDNNMPWHIKKDLQFFKDKTMKKKIVMGKNTFRSIKSKLPGRHTFVISRHVQYASNVTTVLDIDGFIKKYKDFAEEIFICGGASIYRLFLPYAKKLYLTEINKSFEDCDTFFPDFDKSLYTKTILSTDSENGLDFSFVLYEKN